MFSPMLRLHLSSVTPLFVAAGLCMLAIITAWPEPLADGWQWATAGAAAVGALASLPFWQAAGEGQRQRGKNPFGGILAAVLAGILVAVTLLHLVNAIPPGGTAREAVLLVTDKYVTRGRRGRTSHHVRTMPVPGMGAASGQHQVGGLYGNGGTFDDYRIGGCMALRWRPGWWWPVVASRRAMACPAAGAGVADPAQLPLARPGQAWALVQQRLAEGLAGLDLPAQGLRIEVLVTLGTNGLILATVPLDPATRWPDAVTRLVKGAVAGVPFALAGPPGRYRLWLQLMPVEPPPDTGRI
jgi:hypothetical protein